MGGGGTLSGAELPLVSALVPVYNYGRYLGRTLDYDRLVRRLRHVALARVGVARDRHHLVREAPRYERDERQRHRAQHRELQVRHSEHDPVRKIIMMLCARLGQSPRPMK
jgi:hypothetical protein